MVDYLYGNYIIDKVVTQLKTAYPTVPVYIENVPEGFVKPSFFVWEVEKINEKKISNCYELESILAIRYFCNDDFTSSYAHLRDISIVLDSILDTFDNLIGTNKRDLIEDNVLQYFIKFKVRIAKEYNNNDMQTLQTNENIKN